MKKISTHANLLLLLVIALASSSCFKNNNTKPSSPELLTTDVVVDASSKSIWTGGTITNDAVSFSMYGVCYSTTNSQPTINDSKTKEKVIYNTWNSHIQNLTPNTTYYIRAYATNTAGTGYGNVIQIKTGNDITPTYGTVTTFAGSTAGYAEGTGITAMFNHPSAVATDAAGNVYVADAYNSVIRKITPDGVTSTIAGNGTLGYADGPAVSAQFYVPSGLAIDAAGNIFVVDMGNNIIRKISATGVVSTLAGNGSAGFSNGKGNAASFSSPTGIVLAADGSLYVTDTGNSVVRMVTQDGVVTTVAGSRTVGYINGLGTAASLNKPTGIALDATGNIYVTEPGSNAIRKINKGDYRVTTFTGGLDSLSLALGKPQSINIDGNNNMYIGDSNGRILEIKLAGGNVLSTFAGKSGESGSADGNGTIARFNDPRGIATDVNGNVYIADYNNHRIRKIKE
ncbi:hypothetical protein ACFQZX_13855 [Mucilaginibacter litoreus]|uniref:NHL repeat-containing protein n=1 Tax=Mucilaginibacter litoreus TaxID=1048221 RepID=A0ABW3AUH9_9SPHI